MREYFVIARWDHHAKAHLYFTGMRRKGYFGTPRPEFIREMSTKVRLFNAREDAERYILLSRDYARWDHALVLPAKLGFGSVGKCTKVNGT